MFNGAFSYTFCVVLAALCFWCCEVALAQHLKHRAEGRARSLVISLLPWRSRSFCCRCIFYDLDILDCGRWSAGLHPAAPLGPSLRFEQDKRLRSSLVLITNEHHSSDPFMRYFAFMGMPRLYLLNLCKFFRVLTGPVEISIVMGITRGGSGTVWWR
ncbi:hypothetical protein BJV78DRAFT_59747 [Lactifluus subvellereus]|nr:hypothetical protein BJV78DRAFT_59747 [Lactifluus subvellereus]